MTLQKIREFFAVPASKPDLVLAQLKAFSKQIPLLYSILLANMAFVSATHWSVAPLWLALGVPLLFGTAATLRIIGWWRTRQTTYTPEQAAKRLTSTVTLVGVFGAILTLWSLSLLRYGDAYQQGHIAFFMAATLVACVFCLMHLRPAAFLLATLVTVPFTIQFALMPNPTMWAIAANMALVGGTMLYILSTHYNDFATMVLQRADLEQRNAEMQRLNSENHRLANLDSLTNLPNRRSFIASIEQWVRRADGTNNRFAVGLIDLDGFKAVNDLYGHAAGDALLVEASHRLLAMAGDRLSFARLGGDEFGFIAAGVHDLGALGRSICDALGEPYDYEGITAKVTASCGMSLYPATSVRGGELLEFADYALYQAKNDSPGGAIIFNGNHRDQLRLAHQVDQTLRSADLSAEMRLVYQPVVDVVTGETVALEALARWSSEALGQVPPAQFIATAERSPLINKVTVALLNHLLADMAVLPRNIKVSFNLSAKSLCAPQAMLQILSCIQRSGIDPRRLEFEVTESALMANFERALQSLQLLRNLGSTIALDDFGTGYSSLSYVHELPLDKLKIDRVFVSKAGSDRKARNIVRTVLGLSRDLNLKCVAEGVETYDHMTMLQKAGCSLMQGYHFARPMPLADALAHLAKQNPAAQKAAG